MSQGSELEHFRANVDSLIINVPIDAYDEKWAGKEATDFARPSHPAWVDFVLAALHTFVIPSFPSQC